MIERKEIPIEKLVVDEFSVRDSKWTGDEQDQRLLASIKDVGLIHDVCVRERDDGTYGIFAGVRRFVTHRQAGKTTVECKIFDVSDIEALKMSAGENLGRKDLTNYQMMRYINTHYNLVEDKDNIPKGKKYDGDALGAISRSLYTRDSETGRGLVVQFLRMSNLDGMNFLLKKPEERTEAEELFLKKTGIPQSYYMDIRLFDAVGSAARELGIDSPDTEDEAITNILKAVIELGLAGRSVDAQIGIIGDLRDKLKEGKSYTLALQEMKKSPTVGIVQSVGVSFSLTGNHWTWHNHMMGETHSKSNVALVRQVYHEYLEKEAKKRGW